MAKHYSRIRLLTVGWLLMLSGLSTAQTSTAVPDSLARYLKTAPLDTNYLRAADEYVWWLIHPLDQWNRADSLLNQMELLAKRLNDPLGLQRTYWYHGFLSLRLLNRTKALAYFKQAHTLAIKHHQGPAELQRVLWGMGSAYYSLNQYETALRYHLRAISLTEKYGLTNYITRAYIDAGRIMKVMHRPTEQLLYWQKAHILAPREQDKSMWWLTEYYMAECLNGKNKPEAALKHFKQALVYLNQYESKQSRSSVLCTIGDQNMKLNRPKEAIIYLKKAEKLAEQIGNSTRKMDAYNSLGTFYQQQKKYTQAEHYLKKSIQFAHKTNSAIETRNMTRDLAEMYAQAHQYTSAYQYQLLVNQLDDSLFSSQAALKTHDILTRHENEKKEARIKLLDEQNQRTQFQRNAFLIGGILFLLLGVAVSAWLLNRARLRRLQEAQSLRQQIAHDLHDEVGSTLSSISLLSGVVNDLIARNRPESVERAIQKINTDARQILQSVDEIIWTINPGNDSLHRVALRLQEYAQPLMESKDIQFSFAVDPALNLLPVSMEVRRNLYLIGKEAINNLVKYSEATQATVRFSYAHQQLRVLIEDNGRGFDPAQLNNRTGQVSMQQRAKAMGGKLNVRSAPGEGTTLELMAASL